MVIKLEIIGTDKNMISQGVLRFKANDDNWYSPGEIIQLINDNTYYFVTKINGIEVILETKHFKDDEDKEVNRIRNIIRNLPEM